MCTRYLEIGVSGLNYKHGTYIITFTHGIHTNSDNNNKKFVMRKEKGKFHSFNKTLLQQIPMFQKIVMEKKKKKINNNNNNNNTKTKTKWELA